VARFTCGACGIIFDLRSEINTHTRDVSRFNINSFGAFSILLILEG